MLSRRQLFKLGAVAGAGLLIPAKWWTNPSLVRAFSQTSGLRKFVQPLRGVGPGGIPIAGPDFTPAASTGATHYTLGINQFVDKLHPDLDGTLLRGYQPAMPLGGGFQPQKHLGGILVAKKDVPMHITFKNTLSGNHPLPVDMSIMGAEEGPNRTVVHIHGGAVPWISDGGPFAWWDAQGNTGESFLNNKVLNPGAKPGEADYYYPNNLSARMVWYHDHTIGLTRLNAYVGIASAFIIRDDFEGDLRNLGLPDFIENGGYELPIVIQDKIFVNSGTIGALDPTWPGPRATGSLWYPHQYDTSRWDLAKGSPIPTDPSIIPEMFGDTMLANGTVYPEAKVEARRYRLRILNACNARFLNLQLYVDDGSPDGITHIAGSFVPTNKKGPDFLVIGTEGGFLFYPTVVRSNVPFNPLTLGGSLIEAPAERFDVIVDFSGYAGQSIILYNDAPAPFPMGADENDYFPGGPNPVQPKSGFGPNTRQIMRFKIVPATSKDAPLRINTGTALWPSLNPSPVWTNNTVVRDLTLSEDFDAHGRLIQYLGTVKKDHPESYGRDYVDTPTEVVRAGATEVWRIINLTGDTHPIHFHQVNVQVLYRQPFDADKFNGTPSYTGPARGPERTELGWKDTVKMHPGEVTTIITRFDLTKVPFTIPSSPRTGGHEYVWHCHILEHEEHDMMRPLIID
jgi:spore coat protein A